MKPIRLRYVAVAVALILMAGWVAYALVRNGSQEPSSNPPAPSPSPGIYKPFIRGLIAETGVPPEAYRPWVKSFVVNARWADLQPVQGGPIAQNNVIDRAIATARQQGLSVKVRFLAGINAPEWAKSIGGPPIVITDPTDKITGTIGRFWTEDFGRAYNDVQMKLAALYDGVPEIREVTVSRCTTVYAEPFIRDAGDIPTVSSLLAAGFSADADLTCLKEQIDTHAAAWRSTRSGVAFSIYQHIDIIGTVSKDEAFTTQVMLYCRQSLGQRCVLENNSIRSTSKVNGVYAEMKQLGPPISFQTAGPNRIGDVNATLQLAVSIGATSIEILGTLMPQISNIGDVTQAMTTNATHAVV